MHENRKFAAMGLSPFPKNPHSLFTTGGTNGTTQSITSEYLNGGKFSIIVAGGCNGAHLKSTEILDEGSDVWRMGPQLPIGICCAALVEDPAGGVVLVSI